jgi:glycosyltransferase involved in cell wall biosynthesis
VRILLWHGWLLEGSGSNVATARIAEAFRHAGHDVLLLCQDRHPERFAFVDAHGTFGDEATLRLRSNPTAEAAAGRCVVVRPEIGSILPVFVLDRYEGFEDVRRFVDLDDDELETYLRRNAEQLRAAADLHLPDVAFVGHAIPGAAIGRRALGADGYVAKVHGSDLEYAIRPQRRYRELAREGLEAARAVVGPTRNTLDRCAELVPEMRSLGRVVPPGVDVSVFRPRPRDQALLDVASDLEVDEHTRRGRPDVADGRLELAVEARDAGAVAALGDTYEQDVPDPGAAERLRRLAERHEPIVGYLGKLIPQKGVELLLQALATIRQDVVGLVVGFGSGREPLAALASAIERGDREAASWLGSTFGLAVDPEALATAGTRTPPLTFTGMLDHRYAPGVLAAMDVQVVPSTLSEAFGIVAAEGAASGALPLVARHSGLAEVATALEDEVGRPGLCSFEPGDGAVGRIAAGIERLLTLPAAERGELRGAIVSFVRTHWTWERTAVRLLDAAAPRG